MKVKLVAAAVAGLASSAVFAQSNVTIYGTLDLGVRHVTATGKDSVNQVGSMSSNLFGFKGTEDLGGGLSAGFVLEGGISSDTGEGAKVTTTGSKLFSRQSYLSLSSSNLGTAMIGRFNTFGRAAGIRASASPLASVDPLNWLNATAGFSISGNGFDVDNSGGRISNAIGYVSPSFNGLTVGYIHSFAENAGAQGATANNNPGYNLNELWAGYANGPLYVDYVYNNVGAVSVGAQAPGLLKLGAIQEHFLGAGYDFGMFKLLGSYQTRKTELTNADKITNIGASVPVSAAGTVSLSYAKLSLGSDLKDRTKSTSKNLLSANGIGFTNAPANLAEASGWALGYVHALSKRTRAYTTYTHLKNSNDGTFGVGVAPTAGGTANLFSLGMQHNF